MDFLTSLTLPSSSEPFACALPLLSGIAAGFPSPASDYGELALDANEYLVRHRAASYYFSVEGDSMSGVGILDSDKVLVDRAIEPQHGHIVIAVVNNAYTMKRLYRRHGRIELHAENPAYAPICLKDGEELQIWGVVVGLIRKYPV